MHKTIFKESLFDQRFAIGHSGYRHKLRLHIGREARIFSCDEIDRLDRLGRIECDHIIREGKAAAHRLEFVDRGTYVLWIDLVESDGRFSDRPGTEVGACFNTIRDDLCRLE